jgi:polar amino acid transport system substrate-binding protein
MRKFVIAAIAAVAAAGALAAWGFAAPSGSGGNAGPAVTPKLPKLPALPPDVKSRHRWVIGVKCDFPPFGYIDVRGDNAGYDVEIARAFTQMAFGKANRLTLVCVTTPSRIPALMSKRVDIIISTLTYTPARAQVIDFSTPYYSAVGRLLVTNNSSINSLRDLSGKTVITTRGSIYSTWVTNCFKDTKLLEVDSPSSATLALKNGQGDTFMFDDAFLLGVATADRDVKLTKDKFLNLPWGIGIRKGETDMKKWVDTALRRLQLQDRFLAILKNNAPKRLVAEFSDNIPRPKLSFKYDDRDLTTICP